MINGCQSLNLESEFLRLQLKEVAGGWITQEIFAMGKKAKEWKLVLVGEKPALKEPYDSANINDFILLADGASQKFSLVGKPRLTGGAKRSLQLQGISGRHNLKIRFNLEKDSKWLHVQVEDRIKGSSKVEGLKSSYSFTPESKTKEEMLPLDFIWVPNLRPKENYVIGDHVFRSPAVIVQKSTFLAALVPDLEILAENRKMKTVFDFMLKPPNACGPTFGYGFKEYKSVPHVFYQHDNTMVKELSNETLTYGYYMLIDGEAHPQDGFRQVLRFLWRKYASQYLKDVEPQVLSFDEYAKRGYQCTFKQYDIWREGEFEARRIGGTIWQTWDGDPKEGRATEIKNQTWFNNLRSAYGVYHYGKKWGDESLVEKAKLMRNLALASPFEKGLFASALSVRQGVLTWYKGTRGHENCSFYHTADDAWTAYWMLQWYKDHEQDEALVEKCKALGESIVEAQLPSGAIPSWVQVKGDKIEPVPPLEESATTACPAFFLLELYSTTGDKKYLEAAERAAKFIEKNVIPENKWFDFEQYFTACAKKPGLRCEYTGLWGHNNLSLWWATEMYAKLYEAAGNEEYLHIGTRLLDILCLYQQVWSPPYLSFYAFGGFGVMNSDAEWNDARESAFAPTLMKYYTLTGEEEYFQRGVAALRASFALMVIPEHKEIAPGNLTTMKTKDYGATYENYGHLGDDRKIPGQIHFDWGSGSSASAAAYVERRYGDVFVDGKRSKGFGINGCIVDRVTVRGGRIVSIEISKNILRLNEMKIVTK
nr:hypothetical protein [Candidatus Njordarchaeum guaymaensis]